VEAVGVETQMAPNYQSVADGFDENKLRDAVSSPAKGATFGLLCTEESPHSVITAKRKCLWEP